MDKKSESLFVRQVMVDKLTDGIPLDRLEEICNAYRAGTLIIPPCKVGDTVYRIGDDKKVRVIKIKTIWLRGTAPMYFFSLFEMFLERDIGKTVFLTKEAAEQALEGAKI